MTWNIDEDRDPDLPAECVDGGMRGQVVGRVAPRVAPEVAPQVAGGGSGGATPGATPLEEEVSVEDLRQVALLQTYRSRMHDLSDDRFEGILTALRRRQSVKSIARELVEEGYCAHLKPKTIVIYVMKIRDALGLPGYMEQQEETDRVTKETESDDPIEGQPALKRLQWLTRIQHARVRKALKMEGMMGGMVLPLASSEIKLMEDLLDKELEISLKTGEMKEAPKQVSLDMTGLPVQTPAEAYRVVLAYRKLQKIALQEAEKEKAGEAHPELPTAGGETTVGTDRGGSPAAGSASVAGPVPGEGSGPGSMGPGVGSDGGNGGAARVGR